MVAMSTSLNDVRLGEVVADCPNAVSGWGNPRANEIQDVSMQVPQTRNKR